MKNIKHKKISPSTTNIIRGYTQKFCSPKNPQISRYTMIVVCWISFFLNMIYPADKIDGVSPRIRIFLS